MEGYGVATAAAAAGVPFAELRTISNPVGPRDRAAWRLGEALAALTAAAAVWADRQSPVRVWNAGPR
jgi:futalosine hydrolase